MQVGAGELMLVLPGCLSPQAQPRQTNNTTSRVTARVLDWVRPTPDAHNFCASLAAINREYSLPERVVTGGGGSWRQQHCIKLALNGVVCISDTHKTQSVLPPGEKTYAVLIHAAYGCRS
jgi:hypothetical protein